MGFRHFNGLHNNNTLKWLRSVPSQGTIFQVLCFSCFLYTKCMPNSSLFSYSGEWVKKFQYLKFDFNSFLLKNFAVRNEKMLINYLVQVRKSVCSRLGNVILKFLLQSFGNRYYDCIISCGILIGCRYDSFWWWRNSTSVPIQNLSNNIVKICMQSERKGIIFATVNNIISCEW